MKKLYTLLFFSFALTVNAQTVISQWDFDAATPAAAMLPTTGSGTFTTIGGVEENLTSGVMPAGNPSTGKAFSVKTFPAQGTASRTAGFQFAVSTENYTGITVSFDPRSSGTGSKWQQYEYSTDGTTWNIIGDNAGALVNAFTATPMVTVTLPVAAENQANLVFRIVSVFVPSTSAYDSVAGGTYAEGGAWRIDNATFSGTSSLSVKKNAISGLNIYPNPVTNGNLYISSDRNETKAVTIFDVLGKQVLKANVSNQVVNVSNLSKGFYILKNTEAGQTASRKLVIN